MSENLIDVIYAIPHKKVSRGEKFILEILILWGNGVTKNIGASFQFLEEMTGYPNKSIRRMINSLERKSLIFIKRAYTDSHYETNRYTVAVSKLRKLIKSKTPTKLDEHAVTLSETIDKNDKVFYPHYPHGGYGQMSLPPRDKCPYPPTPSKAYPSMILVRPHVFTESLVACLSSNLNSSPVAKNKKILKINEPTLKSDKFQKLSLKHMPKSGFEISKNTNEILLRSKNSREFVHHALIEKLKMKTRDKFLVGDSRMPEVLHDGH